MLEAPDALMISSVAFVSSIPPLAAWAVVLDLPFSQIDVGGLGPVGYASICHPDFAMTEGYNPKMKLLRTKTLMQGDDCCNHCWVMED